MKPRIQYDSECRWWLVLWRYPGEDEGCWFRTCLTWRIAVEQLQRLYEMGDVEWGTR